MRRQKNDAKRNIPPSLPPFLFFPPFLAREHIREWIVFLLWYFCSFIILSFFLFFLTCQHIREWVVFLEGADDQRHHVAESWCVCAKKKKSFFFFGGSR